MAHSGKTMTFATDLVPQEDNIYNLGKSSQRWKIYGDVQPYTSRIYPVLGTTGERSAWYKITFPYHNATTGSAAKWFMNSFDLHFGGGYSSNPSGVAHISFYWTRAVNNGAWALGQGAAFVEGVLANKVVFYYRIAEPGILYVNNTANAYNGIWLDNLYVDDTSPSLDWSTTKIEATSAITANTDPALSAYTILSTTYLYNSGGTLKTDSNFEGKYIKGTWLYTSAATAKTSTSKLATIESDNFIYYITPANALKSAIGTTAIGADKTPIYWTGSAFSAGTALSDGAYKSILNNTSKGALEWNSAGNTNANNLRLINVNTLAYWNGAYSGTNSNLSVLGTVTTGTWNASVIGAAYGGTGQNTLQKSANALINALDTGSSDLTANDYVITQYVGGGTTTTSYHRRPASKVINATLVKAALGTDSSTTNQWLNKKGSWSTPTAAEVGAITKLNSSTDNAILRFDGTAGAIQNSGVIIDDNNHLIAPAIRIANTYYGISFGRTNGTPKETILHTGIKWISSTHMPVIHITGYAYGLQSPVEFKIGFYIYGDKIGWSGATNMGSWEPDIYLFKDTRGETNYVAVGLAGSCYFLQLSVDLQDEMGKFNNVIPTDWTWDFLTTEGTIPSADDGTTCVKVPYKASIFGAKYASITTTSNAIAYYTNTTGTFGSKASANGALYATSANGALQWGTLPIAQGGTGKTSAAEAWTALGGGASGKHDDSYFAKASHNHAASDINSGTFDAARIPNLSWNKITSDKPTTISGYGITDARIVSGVITLGSNTITPVTSVNGHQGASVNVTASDLGLASALKYVGTKSSLPTATDSTTYSTYNNGDVITVSAKEYAYVKGSNAAGSSWVELGDEGSYKLRQTAFANSTGTADGTNTSTSFIYSFSQDENGAISDIKTRQLPTLTNVSYTAATDNNEYPILLKNSTGSDTTAAGVKFANATNKMTTINPSTGMITAPSLTLASNSAIAHLAFARAGWNYVTMPNNDSSVISIGYGTPADNTTQRLVIYKTGTVRPGANGSQNLGDDTHKWNKVYGVNFYGTFNGTATSAQQLAAREIDNSDLNQFSSGGALKYAWVGGGNNILSKPTDVNAFGVIIMKTATNWTGQLLMSTDSEPGLYWRTNLTTETPTYGSWTPLASGNGGVYYGTCSTAADVVEKVVVCKHYHTLKAGDIIVVTFTNSNTQAQPKLNVNNTGAVDVKMAYSGGIVDLGSTTQLSYTCTFIYNGAKWLIINQQNTIQLATASNQTNWRSILLSNSNSGDENFTPSANTLGRTYAAHNVKYQPSTGTLRAPIIKTPKVQIEYDHVNKAHIQWNDTDSSIDFIFD